MAEASTSLPGKLLRLGGLFLLLGPPIGALLPALLIAANVTPTTPDEYRSAQFNAFAVIILFSYLVGGVPALLTGMGTALLAARQESVSLWQTLLVALLASAATAVVTFGLSTVSSHAIGWQGITMLGFFLVSALPATFACWAIARRRGWL